MRNSLLHNIKLPLQIIIHLLSNTTTKIIHVHITDLTYYPTNNLHCHPKKLEFKDNLVLKWFQMKNFQAQTLGFIELYNFDINLFSSNFKSYENVMIFMSSLLLEAVS
jgi:hypothetical protein